MRGECLVSKSSVWAYLRSRGVRVSSRFVPQLDGKAAEMLEAAIKRAGMNGRGTVMAQDL